MTQAQLAEGVCSRESIVKIESGQRSPDWFTFSQIMTRLGEDPKRYFNRVVTEDDKRIIEFRSKADTEMRKDDEVALKKLIDEADNDELFQGAGRHAYLEVLAGYYNMTDDHIADVIPLILEALTICRPNFELDKIDEYFLAQHEIQSINKLAIAYVRLYGEEKMLEILFKLKANYEKQLTEQDLSKDDTYISILSNISSALWRSKQYDRVLEYAEKGYEYAYGIMNLRYYYKFILAIANAHYGMGEKEKGIQWFMRSQSIYYAMAYQPGIEEAIAEWKHFHEEPPEMVIELYTK
jgi:DNA-binding XRE family transcriptional regulator